MGDEYEYNENEFQNNSKSDIFQMIYNGNSKSFEAQIDFDGNDWEYFEVILEQLGEGNASNTKFQNQMEILDHLLAYSFSLQSKWRSQNVEPLRLLLSKSPEVSLPVLKLIFSKWKEQEADFEKMMKLREETILEILRYALVHSKSEVISYIRETFPTLDLFPLLTMIVSQNTKNSLPILESLFTNNIRTNPGYKARLKDIQTAIYKTLESPRSIAITKYLIARFPEVDLNASFGAEKGNALHYAIIWENVEAIKYLLSLPSTKLNYINMIRDNLFVTALKVKNKEKRMEIVKAFLTRPDLDLSFKNSSDKTALMIAVDSGDIDLVKLLLRDPRLETIVNVVVPRTGFSAADFAAQESSLSWTPKDPAKQKDFDEILKLLLPYAKNLTAFMTDGSSVLNQAVVLNRPDFVDLLLKKNPESINQEVSGGTVLMNAIQAKHKDMIDFLLSKGAKLDQVTSTGSTPLEAAFLTKDSDIIFYILEKRQPSQQEVTDLIVRLASSTLDTLRYALPILSDVGFDTSATKDSKGRTLLMLASEGGNEELAKFLLERGDSPLEFVDKTVDPKKPIHQTAYDIAKDMSMRLLLAPYLEKDKPVFKGFTKPDMDFSNVLYEKSKFVICPFCFAPLEHNEGCSYLYEHNCYVHRQQLIAAGVKSVPFIHEKLLQTYLDPRGKVTVCIHCNRSGFSFTEEMIAVYGGQEERVGHQHIRLRSANPYVTPEVAPKHPFGYHDKTGCYSQGGGSFPEKAVRYQTMINFMCFLNTHFIGKISNHMAHMLCREVFWDAPLKDYILRVPFSKTLSDVKITGYPSVDALVKDISDDSKKEKNFLYVCEPPLPTAEEEVEKEEEEDKPNVPRYGTNEVDLAPVETTENAEEGPDQRICYYNAATYLNEPHGDGRKMWGFRHRQPGLTEIHDHNAMKEYICEPCLTDHFQGTFVNQTSFRPICFGDCKGHFHPSEVKGKIPDDIYERYRKIYNLIPPDLSRPLKGGGRSQSDYPPVLGPPDQIQQDSCPVPRRMGGRRRRTRRIRKVKKTRRANRYRKTRR